MNTQKAHERWLGKVAREAAALRLKRARQAVADARRDKRTARARARQLCNAARAAFRVWLTREREALAAAIAALRERLKLETVKQRAKVAACCGKDERDRVRAASDLRIQTAREKLAALLEEQKREKIWTQPVRAADRRTRRDESDHSVEVNLTPDQLVVWRKVKTKIHGTDRMTRTEAFQHWMHDNSADVGRILAEDAEAAYQAAVRAELRERKALRKSHSPAERRALIAKELEAVPF